MQPSEFWALSTQEFWWEYDMRIEVIEKLKDNRPGFGGFSNEDWKKARKRHKEKMNDAARSPSR